MTSPRRVLISAWLLAIAVVAVFMIGWLNDSHFEPGEWRHAVGLAAVYATPAIVAMIAVRREIPVYAIAAAAAMAPLLLASIVLIPGLILVAALVSGVDRYVPLRRGLGVEVVGALVIVAGTLTAFVMMLVQESVAGMLVGLIPLAVVLAMANVSGVRMSAPVDPPRRDQSPADLQR